jgi:tetraacyldisaccharide-1-P 4'-kinase
MTRCDQVASIDTLREEISLLTGGRPVFRSQMRTARVSGLKNSAETLGAPARVAAFCGVGNPSSFFEQLRSAGFEVVLEKSFPDHHSYSQDEIESLVQSANQVGASGLLTTAKDAVKLRAISFSFPCYVLEIEMSIENSDQLTQLLRAAL